MEARLRSVAPALRQDQDPDVLEAATRAVASFLYHPEATLRDNAIQYIGITRAADYLADIEAHITHEIQSTRVAAMLALGEFGRPQSLSLLVRAIEENSEEESTTAIQILGRIGNPEAEDTLSRIAREGKPKLRAIATQVLGSFDTDTAKQTLARLTHDSDRQVARAAAKVAHIERPSRRKESEFARQRLERIRGDSKPVRFVSVELALRALPQDQDYEESQLTRLIASVCHDFSTTRRLLVMDKLMRRQAGIYQFTELGKAVWRVERFIADHYLHWHSDRSNA